MSQIVNWDSQLTTEGDGGVDRETFIIIIAYFDQNSLVSNNILPKGVNIVNGQILASQI